MKRLLSCTLIMFAIALVPVTARAVNIAPTGDTFGYQFLPGFNANSGFFGNFLPVGNTTTGHSTKSLLQFTLPGGLTAAQVDSATLKLFVGDTVSTGFGINPGPGAAGVDVAVYPLLGSWDVNTVAWSGAVGPPQTFPVPGAGAVASTLKIEGINQTVSFNVTQLVKDWLNGVIVNNGVVLEATNTIGTSPNFAFAVFSSQETANDPVLQINVLVPEPGSLALAGLGLVGAACVFIRKRRVSSVR